MQTLSDTKILLVKQKEQNVAIANVVKIISDTLGSTNSTTLLLF